MSWTFYNSSGEALVQHAESEAVQSEMEDESAVAKFVPPDLVKYSPGVAKAYARITGSDGANDGSYGLSGSARNSTGVYLLYADPDFSGATMVPVAVIESASTNMAQANRFSDGTRYEVTTTDSSGSALDDDSFSVAFGELV